MVRGRDKEKLGVFGVLRTFGVSFGVGGIFMAGVDVGDLRALRGREKLTIPFRTSDG